MSTDLTDTIDKLESNLDEIECTLTPMFKIVKELRADVMELQDALKHEENRNADFENKVDYLESFIAEYNDLYIAWQVANRMEE